MSGAGSSDDSGEDDKAPQDLQQQLPRKPDQRDRWESAPGFDMQRGSAASGRQGQGGREGRGRRGRGARGGRGGRGRGGSGEATRTGYNPYALTDGGVRGASKRKPAQLHSGNRTMTFKSKS